MFDFEGHAIKWGQLGAGPPLVLIHGTPFPSQVWRRVLPHLTEYRSIYFYDLLGYGESEKRVEQDVSLGVQNRLLAALFKEWRLDRPDVVAHDFGGATALRAYFLERLRFASLTIFDAVALAPWGRHSCNMSANTRLHSQACRIICTAPFWPRISRLPLTTQ
ncbi:alpha/beta fold hydrolase [Jannaschia faecimaris]|uniref:alpha/beta fold hydrolase n=1 Tax=Jannaschia faecimaris TaxID=1244108 RepID=UPI001FCDA114|nr:alpha/beta fold hydrolase [Jannaschia faecimaris]